MNVFVRFVNIKKWLIIILLFVVLIIRADICLGAEAIDFDSLSTGVQPGNVLSASGVIFTTGNIPDTVILNNVIAFSNAVSQFEIFSGSDAISPPNFAVALGGLQKDILMSFTTPVTSVTVTSDCDTGEWPDIIRLLALKPTNNPDQFIVQAIDEAFDNAISSPGNLLTVNLNGAPFEFAIFQTTTEQEGFDDLTFNLTPEPATICLLGFGISGLVRRKR